jgi:alkanesulfonate monooxygenase SsuD/methylene tetrahydromethanopterin reductase-like flavin-dependent oxidoreductase (luciferase family)
VLTAGLWAPLARAAEVATLDVVSAGRAWLGVGAGHTPQEWTSAGRLYPAAGARVDHLIELLDTTRALLAGDTVSHEGRSITLDRATLASPRPVQDPVPVTVGGGGDRVLRYAAEVADRVGVTGLGRTLADGHQHEVRWDAAAVDRTCDLVRRAAAATGRAVVLEALVQHVQVTDDGEAAAQQLQERLPDTSVADLLASPYVWIGTVEEIRANLGAQERQRGITAYVVRAPVLDAVLAILG